MRYKSFRIQNFKGIKDTTVHLDGIAGAAVFAFVGLNESGKTTVLEAIHSFSPDAATNELIGGDEVVGVPIKDRVPRHSISTFTGEVSVTATLLVTDDDKQSIAEELNAAGIEIEIDNFPSEVVFERHQRFEDGDFKETNLSLRTPIQIKSPKQRRWREPEISEKNTIMETIYNYTPDIAYFPTFVFDFPETIFLTERGGPIDQFYRRVFQDVLDFDGRGHTIEKDIIRRVRGAESLHRSRGQIGLLHTAICSQGHRAK